MKHLFKILVTLTCVFLYKMASSQADLPKIIKPSPSAAALFRFQDYPMDLSTGLPQISIPIYEISSGSLSLPISLSYHASGRKVYDQDGSIALGWTLNAGGMISRTIYGSPDFGTPSTGTYKFPYPFKIDNLSNNYDLNYLQKIIHCTIYDCNVLPWMDSEYDVFSYSIGNNSGKLIFKDNNNVKTPVLLPYKPYVVTPTYTNIGLTQIDMTDDKGIQYQFSASALYSSVNNSAVTSWSITRIISADKVDTISFEYTGISERRTTISQTANLIDDWNMYLEAFPTDNLTYNETTSQEDYSSLILTSITYRQGKVLFNINGSKITGVQIFNYKNEIVRSMSLTTSLCYSQSELQTATNKLDMLTFNDQTGAQVEKYSFSYYPLVSSNGQMNPRYCDWWGYYNNSGVHDMVPAYNNLEYFGSGTPGTINVGNSSANREPSLEPMKSGVLKSITYPTGGQTEFSYEINQCVQFGTSGAARNGPGLRISQISSSEGLGSTSLIKTYKYGINESGYGTIDVLPALNTMATENTIAFMGGDGVWTPTRAGKYRQRIFYSGFMGELSALAERPVIYSEVAEYNGTPAANNGKTVYNYDYNGWAASAMSIVPRTIPRLHIYNFNYWDNPSVSLKTEYAKVATGYQKVRTEANSYTNTVIENVRGLHVQRIISLPQTGVAYALPPGETTFRNVCSEFYAISEASNNVLWPSPSIYTFSDYQIPVGEKRIVSKAEIMYNEDGSIVTNSTSYSYNGKSYISQKVQNTSDGGSLVTNFTFPFDYTGNPVLTQMISPSINMLDFPVEQTQLKNTIPVSSVRTNYFNFGSANPMIKPLSIDVKKGANLYETRLQYLSYDNSGNLTSVSKTNDAVISYIWDYNKSYPVAEVKNAGVGDVAFTSFEAEGGGNWSFAGAPILDASPLTGKKVYNPSDGVISKTIGTASAYIVSYWSKSGAKSVTGTTSTSGRTINGWTYYEHTGTFSAGANISVSGNGVIDELRLYPKAAQMTSYTYSPLVGQTTVDDTNGVITYYEYDSYARLKLIRDLYGNILKTFKYQYQSLTP